MSFVSHWAKQSICTHSVVASSIPCSSRLSQILSSSSYAIEGMDDEGRNTIANATEIMRKFYCC